MTAEEQEASELSRSCFVISEIGESGTDTRARANKILTYVIRPAAEAAGYRDVDRADEIRIPGRISRQIIGRLIDADVVVADLTGHNPNVFYELAMRHAFVKPSVILFDRTIPLPFDVHDLRAIPVSTDVEDANAAREALTEMLRELKQDPARYSETPFTAGIDLAALLSAARVAPDDVTGRLAHDVELLQGQVASLSEQMSRAIVRAPISRFADSPVPSIPGISPTSNPRDPLAPERQGYVPDPAMAAAISRMLGFRFDDETKETQTP